MGRKTVVLAVVVLVALLAATPVLAGGSRQQHQYGELEQVGTGVGAPDRNGDDGDFKVRGNILSLDSVTGTIELEVLRPLWFAKDNPVINVLTTENTIYRLCDDGTCIPITFDDLEVGWQVRVFGTTDGVTYAAVRVVHNLGW